MKTAIDQLVWAPAMTVVFFTFLKVLEGHPEQIMAIINAKFLPTLLANYALWPTAHLFNFKFVPSDYRILFNNVISIAWNAYISWTCAGPSPPDGGSGGRGILSSMMAPGGVEGALGSGAAAVTALGPAVACVKKHTHGLWGALQVSDGGERKEGRKNSRSCMPPMQSPYKPCCVLLSQINGQCTNSRASFPLMITLSTLPHQSPCRPYLEPRPALNS